MYSLKRRLLLLSTVLVVLFLGVMGAGLNSAFEESVIDNAKNSLRNQILLLMSSIEVEGGKVIAPAEVFEPRLLKLDSDLFAQIEEPSPQDASSLAIVWRSASLLDRDLPSNQSSLGEFMFFPNLDWNGDRINVMTLAVEWETTQGTTPFLVKVGESNSEYISRLARYKRQVLIWLSLFGGALIVLLLGMLDWTLKPLERVRRQVAGIEEGDRRRLDEDYPLEVTRLTKNLNNLLDFEEQRIDRQKEVLGNLAHSLKTPIAILKGLDFNSSLKPEVDEQLGSMENIINYQLQSASTIGRRHFSKAISIEEPTQKIVRSLQKLYSTKEIHLQVEIHDGVSFFGDEGDWMEVIGNLCENAFKWCERRISLKIVNLAESDGSRRLPVSIVIQDDGPGINADSKDKILQRGVRLDSQIPGHGLGMHIVKGIVEAYEGSIAISASDYDTGTKFSIILA